MEKTNKKLPVIIAAVTIVVYCIGIAYAYFTARISGNDTASSATVTVGKLMIDFDTTEYISNQYGELIQDSEKESKADANKFSVKHSVDSNIKADYTLSLTDIRISDNLKSSDFKWELVKNDTVLSSGNFSDIGTSTTLNLTPNYQRLEVNNTDKYIFRIWLSETDVDQSSLYNGTFSAKISLIAKSA